MLETSLPAGGTTDGRSDEPRTLRTRTISVVVPLVLFLVIIVPGRIAVCYCGWVIAIVAVVVVASIEGWRIERVVLRHNPVEKVVRA